MSSINWITRCIGRNDKCSVKTGHLVIICLITLLSCAILYQSIQRSLASDRKRIVVTDDAKSKSSKRNLKEAQDQFLDQNIDEGLARGNGSLIPYLYVPAYTHPPPDVCETDGYDPKILVSIVSAPGHFAQRRAIRFTWASFKNQKDVKIVFILGQTDNRNITKKIEDESLLYSDIVEGLFLDSPGNATLKTVFLLSHATKLCENAGFLVKTKDDVFVNMPVLLDLVDKDLLQERFAIWGYESILSGKRIGNDIDWSTLPKTLKKHWKYPRFFSDEIVIFTMHSATKILEAAGNSEYTPMESVLFTGIIPTNLNIERIQLKGEAAKKEDALAANNQTTTDMFIKWNIISNRLYKVV